VKPGHRYYDDNTRTGTLTAEDLATRPATEIFADMIAGRAPVAPIAKTLNFKLVEASDGFAEFRGVPLAEHYNPAGSVHGGWTATLLDSALGCCVHTKVPAGFAYTTIEFKVNILRPMFENTGEVICQGRVLHFGRTTAVSEATLKSADGKLIAIGTETCAIFPFASKG